MKPTPLLYSSLHTVIKLFAIAFTCVYLHLTVGVVKTTHYCMGRESNSILYTFEAKQCACSLFLSNLEKEPCCHDESEVIVLDGEQTIASLITVHAPEYYSLRFLYDEALGSSKVLFDDSSTKIEEDPPPLSVPRYTFFCNPRLCEDGLVA